MKKYEKPDIGIISLEANETFCQTCAIDAVEPNMNQELKDLIELADYLNPFTGESELNCADVVQGYCKFGPSGALIFNS